jgi:hypothetical protein
MQSLAVCDNCAIVIDLKHLESLGKLKAHFDHDSGELVGNAWWDGEKLMNTWECPVCSYINDSNIEVK